ncbi:hypothetical protein [Marivivens sp. JLT3646]|uniref:hypothetical protein n=1 Tax=Marivivens sp. JLT3646 TaxID=1920883 RepID=UPI0007FF7A0A|nr:hypothetical protein [Marivivens sp. JLT3646]APO86157.1 hypothetical protein BSK21_03325 [Marivivens sp. JLT3646]OBR38036.1 hypothetical protein A9199_15475 [Donghicola sp. JL3646]
MGFLSKLLGIDKVIRLETEKLSSTFISLQKIMPHREVIIEKLQEEKIPFNADENAIVWQIPFNNIYAARFVLGSQSEYIQVYFLSSIKFNSFEYIQIQISESVVRYFYPKKRNDLSNMVLKIFDEKGFSGVEAWSPK